MAALRFPTHPPQTLQELFERVRDVVRQLETKELRNVEVETTETAVAHGLGHVPSWVGMPIPHCLSLVRQTKRPDDKCIYLRASNKCVVHVELTK